MTRRSIFASFVVALAVVMVAGWAVAGPTPPAPVYPSHLSLASTGNITDFRSMASKAAVGNGTITIGTAGNLADAYTLSGGTALTVKPTSGTFAKNSTATTKFTFSWTGTALGPQSGVISLTDANPSGGTETLAVSGEVLANRTLTAMTLGTTASPVRTMAGTTLNFTLSSGTTAADSDSEATRVNIVSGGTVSGSNVLIKYDPSNTVPEFDAEGQSALLDLVLGTKTGLFKGTAVDLSAKMLSNGEAAYVGAKVQKAPFSYAVASLANRQLTIAAPAKVAPTGYQLPARLAVTSGNSATYTQTTISTGTSGPADTSATRLAINPAATVSSPGGDVTVGYYSLASTLTTFNGPKETAALGVTLTGLGLHSGSLNLAPTDGSGLVSNGEAGSVGATVLPEDLNYSTDVLQNRQLTVENTGPTPGDTSVSTTLSSVAGPVVRVMDKTPYTITISNGTSPLPDSEATRINLKSGSLSNSDLTVKSTTKLAVFDGGTGEDQTVTVTFGATGAHSGSLDLTSGKSALLVNGEAVSAGAAMQSENLNYNVVALEQRKLSVVSNSVTIGTGMPTTMNNVLKGSYVGFGVKSSNASPDSSHTTSVALAGAVGGVAFLPTAATIVSSGPNATVYGLTQYTTGSKAVSGTVGVQTAEALSVGDTKSYSPLTFKTPVLGNVGTATLGSSAAAPPTQTTFGPALIGFVPSGFTLGSFAASASASGTPTYSSMSSKVNPAGTLAGGSTNYAGPVGSEAQILTSTRVAADTLVTMAWRQRNAYESGTSSTAPAGDSLPGVKYLTSDVVQVGMTASTSPLVYAMQMSFNQGINTNNDHGNTALTEFNNNSLYLAQLMPASGTNPGGWQNAVLGDTLTAGINAKTHVNDSLADFLNQKLAGLAPGSAAADQMLASLVGSWGVDTTNDQAWAIIDHAGTMAVVPEPATALLLLSAGGVMLWYRRWRRRSGCANG